MCVFIYTAGDLCVPEVEFSGGLYISEVEFSPSFRVKSTTIFQRQPREIFSSSLHETVGKIPQYSVQNIHKKGSVYPF